MHSNTEQEWQFSAPQLSAARDWLAAQPKDADARRFSPRPTLELRDTYYDSADWMLYRAGFALRLRQSRTESAESATAEVTLKSLRAARGGFARRQELSQRVTTTDIRAVLVESAGIGERIRELLGTRPLAELFRATTRRERQRLLEADSDLPLAEVDLDETRLEAAGASQTLQRVEVECLHAEPAALDGVVQQLRDAAQLTPADASKFRSGLSLAGLHPEEPLLPGPRLFAADEPVATSLLAILRRYFAAVLEGEPLVRLGSAEAVHDMRVAARHLDTVLRATRAFAPSWASAARGAIGALVKQLGAVRDCDVQLAQLDATLAAMPAAEREPLVPLRERLAAEHHRARTLLLRELDSPRARAFRDHWRVELGAPPAATPPAAATGVVALELLRQRARKLRKRGAAIGHSSTPDDYHRVRIAAKRLRYVLDAFAGLYGPAARDFDRALAKLQDVLGAFHDAAVRDQRFAEFVAGGSLPPATSFAIGRLVERDAGAFARCRRKFPKAYRRLRGRRWKDLRAAMRRVAAATDVSAP